MLLSLLFKRAISFSPFGKATQFIGYVLEKIDAVSATFQD